MAKQSFELTPIRPGFTWTLQIDISGAAAAPFPVASMWRSSVREATDKGVLATATVARVDDDSISVALTAAESAKLANLNWTQTDGINRAWVLFDLIRTDTSPEEPADLILRIPVVQSPSAT